MPEHKISLSYVGIGLLYFQYFLIIVLGHVWDLFDKPKQKTKQNYPPLTNDFESFYTRRLYGRIADCWNRPINGLPGSWIDVCIRKSPDPVFFNSFELTGEKKRCLNLASYNYLGFASTEGKALDDVVECVMKFGIACASPRAEVGSQLLHEKAEKMVAEYVSKEAAMIFGMGYATNSTTIPAICGKEDLIISDSLNHASLVAGCRTSGARVKVFHHNDPKHLEKVIREAIVEGQARTHRPYGKILIVVEGIYSMEGEICKLREIVALKKKYNCYLYVDEAHSIGAIGKHGRGVCDHWGVDPAEVDILMGTFTKSFASVGGYVAADKNTIDYLRQRSFGQVYETAMVPGTVQQVVSALTVMAGRDGTSDGKQKIKQLRDNSNFFRRALVERGFQVFGDADSPVIPVMVYQPAKLPALSRECLNKNMAVVVVGFPATNILFARIRFCISASHTRDDLEWAIKEFDDIGGRLMLKYGTPDKARLLGDESPLLGRSDSPTLSSSSDDARD